MQNVKKFERFLINQENVATATAASYARAMERLETEYGINISETHAEVIKSKKKIEQLFRADTGRRYHVSAFKKYLKFVHWSENAQNQTTNDLNEFLFLEQIIDKLDEKSKKTTFNELFDKVLETADKNTQQYQYLVLLRKISKTF